MKIAIIIPTKNRSSDLINCIKSINQQKVLPTELIIVDQSDSDDTRSQLVDLCTHKPYQLNYIYNRKISGLVHAKEVGVKSTACDIVSFIEDDVVLSVDYVEQVLKGFDDNPHALGFCGIVKKIPKRSFINKLFFKLFHLGIFSDNRINFHGKTNHQTNYIPAKVLSGGVSSFSRNIFNQVRFDITNPFFHIEDVEISHRLRKKFGSKSFLFNTRAQLEHMYSPINRNSIQKLFRKKTKEYILFAKKNNSNIIHFFSLLWLLLGLFIESFFSSLRYKRIDILQGYFSGLKEGLQHKVI